MRAGQVIVGVVLCGVCAAGGGCKGKSNGSAGSGASGASATKRAHPVRKGAPGCTPDGSIPRPKHTRLLVVDDALIGATWDADRGVVLSKVDGGQPFGAPLALPRSPMGRVHTLVRTDEGFAAIVRLFDGEDEAGRALIARFRADGTPIGEAHEIADGLAHFPMAGFDVAAVGDRLVLLEETKMLAHTQLQVVDLDGKAIGAAVEGEANRFSVVAPIGVDGHALAILQRDREGGPERVRVFDVDKRAWVAPAVALGSHGIYGAAPSGEAAILFGPDASGMNLAPVTADGKLGAWTSWGSGRTGHWIASSPDGSRTLIESAAKGDGDAWLSYLAAVQPDLTVIEDATGVPGAELASDDAVITSTTVYAPVESTLARLRCSK